MPYSVASDEATTDAKVSGTETIDIWDMLGCSERKIPMLPCREENISMEALKATGLTSPNFWTSYSHICSFISHKSKQSVREKILFSTLMYCHTLNEDFKYRSGLLLKLLCLSTAVDIMLFTFALK